MEVLRKGGIVEKSLGEKILLQREQMEVHLTEMIEIHDKYGMDTSKFLEEIDGINDYVNRLAMEFSALMKQRPDEKNGAFASQNAQVNSTKEKHQETTDPSASTRGGFGMGGRTSQDARTSRMGGMNAQRGASAPTTGGMAASQGRQDGSEHDPTGLFLPIPRYDGLSTEEQRSMERVHTESLKKLPTISLRTFSGKQGEDFLRWKVHFMRIIDSQTTLSKCGKMTFLLQALKGRALDQIEKFSSLNFSDSSYDRSLDLLEQLYGGVIRENARVTAQFSKLKPLRNLSATELSRIFISLTSLRDFHMENKNDFNLTNPASSDFRDARTKLGSYLHEFDIWLVKSGAKPCFNALLDYVKELFDAAQMSSYIDYEDDSEDEQTNYGSHNKQDGWRSKETQRGGAKERYKETTEKSQNSSKCVVCKVNGHKITSCAKAKKMPKDDLFKLCLKEKMCFRCLIPGHRKTECRANQNVVCRKDGCKLSHHWMLHDDNRATTGRTVKHTQKRFQGKSRQEKSHGAVESDEAENDASDSERESDSDVKVDGMKSEEVNDGFKSQGASSGKVSIQVTSVRVHYKGKSTMANILLDEGSNSTNVSESLVRKLGMRSIDGPKERTITVMSGKRIRVSSNLMKFEISPARAPRELSKFGIDKSTKFRLEAWSMDSVCGKSSLVNWAIQKSDFSHLKDLQMPNVDNSENIDIVLGTDYPGLLAVLESRVGPRLKDPVAHLTRLGWVCLGPSRKKSQGDDMSALSFRAEECVMDEKLDMLARTFWEGSHNPGQISGFTTDPNDAAPREVIGFSARNRKFHSEESNAAYKKMTILHKEEENVYVAKIPWKDTVPDLKSNRSEVMKRQQSTIAPNYLKKKGVELENLVEIIDDYEKKGYIRQVEGHEIVKDSWYLPWFPVVDKGRATTKIRIVFDGASRFDGKSLNSEALTGPNLLIPYLQILFRFRKYRYCFIGDIAEMFLKIHLNQDDQKYHRFLFTDKEGNMKDYQWCRTVFGNKSIPNISQKVLHCLVEDFGKDFPEAVQTILLSIYMDDLCDSRKTENEVSQSIKELCLLLQKADMKPRKWMSNSGQVLDQIPVSERAKEIELVGDSLVLNDGKILGVQYSPAKDEFFIVGKETPGGKASRRKVPLDKYGDIQWTKRNVLSLLFKQYDPLGFVSPYTVRGKVILQRLTTLDLTWDEPIPDHYRNLWVKWLDDLKDLGMIRIKRHLGMGEDGDHSVHIFCDASVEAVCCVAYLRTELNGQVEIAFLMSRTRVTPLKAVSIARLELIAAQLGAETSVKVRKYLGEAMPYHYYTDSRDVLYWLSQPSKIFKTFVANRTGACQALTKISEWRHVPSAQNAADLGTRGMTVADLAQSEMWWKGPKFLQGPASGFPPRFNVTDYTVEKSIKDEFRPLLNFHCTSEDDSSLEMSEAVTKFLDPKLFSVGELYDGWKALRRRATYMVSTVKKTTDGSFRKKSHGEKEIQAEMLLIKMAQSQSYGDIIEALQSNKPIPKKHSLAKFAPFLDENGLLRSKSRLEHSDIMPEGTRLPIILPSKHRITFLMVMSAHQLLQHAVGDNMLRGHLAKRFIIPSMYYLERKIKKECVECVKRNAKAGGQQMGPLPSYRLTEPPQAFSRVGIDFAGPFQIKMKRETRTQACRPKYYVLVFSCLQTRAVHFEVTPSVETDAVLNALSRFCDRRGVPNLIVSDNAKSFEAADKVLRELWSSVDKDKIKEVTTNGYKQTCGVKWEFIPPYSAHMGGVYEIIVKAMKRALHSIYGYADLYLDEFQTAITAAEGLLNARPLAEVRMEAQESVILTPNHFLNAPGGDLFVASDCDISLAKKWKHVNTLQKHYKSRFVNEILAALHPRRKWQEPIKQLDVGDLALELSDSEPRSLWKLGRIVEVIPGGDDLVRKVKVQFKGNSSLFTRSVHRLFPLEFGKYEEQSE
jgi:hypothetical protein